MFIFKYNIFVDIRAIIRTIFTKKILDKYRYIYYLSTINKNRFKKINYSDLTNRILMETRKYPTLEKDTNRYFVYLSKYGALGSYAMPNKVFINIQREPEDITKTIIHEIIHLQVENQVIANHLTQDEKEKMVDDLTNKITIETV
jgi:hypothetical protein